MDLQGPLKVTHALGDAHIGSTKWTQWGGEKEERETSHKVGRGMWIKEEMEEREQGWDLLKAHYMHYKMFKKTKIDHT